MSAKITPFVGGIGEVATSVVTTGEKCAQKVLLDLLYDGEGHFVTLLEDGTEVKHKEARDVEFEDHSAKKSAPTTLEEALKRIEELEMSERTLKRQVDEMAQEIRE